MFKRAGHGFKLWSVLFILEDRMIEYIEVSNEFMTQPEQVRVLGVSDAPDNGLWLVKMDNIGEVQATINTTDYAIADGSFRNTNRVSKRNITMKFRLTDSFANKIDQLPKNIEQSRLRLYKMFPYKSDITLKVKTDTNEHAKVITGYVESVDPDVFSNKETVSVSLICPDPYFIMHKEVAVGRGFDVAYDGSASTGVVLNIDCGVLQNNKDFSIEASNGSHNTELFFDINKVKELIGQSSVHGYRLHISSELGNKYTKMTGPGTGEINVMSAMGIGPFGWPYLYQGVNEILVKVDGAPISDAGLPAEDIEVITDDTEKPSGFDNNEIIVKFKERYGGI